MHNIKDRHQLTFYTIPKWRGYLTEKQIKDLDKSWAGTFRQFILPLLPVERIKTLYSDDWGRPSNELYTIIGACVLQQVFDLTDEDTQQMLSYNKQWHYALDNFDLDDHRLSVRSIWTMRQILIQMDLIPDLFENANKQFTKILKVNTSHQRIDSSLISSNMARIGRVRILSRVIHKFLINLKRQYVQHYQLLEAEHPDLVQRYIRESDPAYFGSVKPSHTQKRLLEIANDLYFLIQRYASDNSVTKLYSYGLLTRVFSEHCNVVEGQAQVRPNKEVPSTSIQNPSDIDATYNGHKKKSGYSVQLMETYTPAVDEGESDSLPGLDLITHVEVTPAHVHDSNAIAPALEDMEEQETVPDVLLADSAYGSDDNVEMAHKSQVDLVSPVKGTNKTHDFTGFVLDPETSVVLFCPFGKSPDRINQKRKTGIILVHWDKQTCRDCPLAAQCPTSKMKKSNRLRYEPKDFRLWCRRTDQKTEEFTKLYRRRSGVEGSLSRLMNTRRARRSRYRGLSKVRYGVITKALGENIFRTAKYIRSLINHFPNIPNPDLYYVKKRLFAFLIRFLNLPTGSRRSVRNLVTVG